MKISRKAGTTSEILQIFIRDSSSLTGAGLTGLTNASSGLTAYYCRNDQGSATSISVVTMTLGTYTSGGFKELDATNMPGWYQFCPPNAVFTSGRSAAMHLKGVTNMVALPIEVELTAVDNQSASAFLSLTALADAILDRDMSTGTDSGSPSVRTVRQALRVLRNKVSATAGTMTVTKEDDTTSSWTAALTTDGAAQPITVIDPA